MSSEQRHERAVAEAARTRCPSMLGTDQCGLDAGHRGVHYDGENRWSDTARTRWDLTDHTDGMHTPESAARAFRPTQLERERASREAAAAAAASAWRALDDGVRIVLRVHAPEVTAALDALKEVHRG